MLVNIDLRGWRIDESNSPYPEGSRDKYALIAPEDICQKPIIANHRYLMKFSRVRYPIQFWSEIIAYKIAGHMGVPCPETYYAEDAETKEPGSLISWFYGKEIEPPEIEPDTHADVELDIITAPENAPSDHSLYIPGSSYMARLIKDFDLKKGSQHNLGHLRIFLTMLRRRYNVDYWGHWSKVLTFDAIIGNTDRHQDNWGVLWRRDRRGSVRPRMSPAFDNGTSLLHEIAEDKLIRFADESTVRSYVERGRHHLRLEITEGKGVAHIALLESLVNLRPELIENIEEAIAFDISQIRSELMELCAFSSPVPLTEARVEAICSVITYRQKRIKEICT